MNAEPRARVGSGSGDRPRRARSSALLLGGALLGLLALLALGAGLATRRERAELVPAPTDGDAAAAPVDWADIPLVAPSADPRREGTPASAEPARPATAARAVLGAAREFAAEDAEGEGELTAPDERGLAAPAPAAPFRARFVDELTGEPLEGVRVTLWRRVGDGVYHDLDHVGDLYSDANGWIASPHDVICGPLSLETRFGRMLEDREIDVEHDGREPPCLALAAGVPFEIAVAGGPDDVEGELDLLREEDEEWLASTSWPLDGPLRVALDGSALRVRFESDDGLWAGSAPVVGSYPAYASVQLEARGALRVHLREGRRRGVEEAHAEVRLGERVVDCCCRDGERVRALEPGTYRVSAQSPRHEPAEREVLVEAGRTAEVELVLAPLEIGGVVEGEITSVTGREVEDCSVRLWTNGGALHAEPLWFERDGRLVGSFRILDVPVGEHWLCVRGPDGFDWSPSRCVPVTAPTSGIELVCDDRLERVRLSFRVVTEQGEPLPWWCLELGDARGRFTSTLGASGEWDFFDWVLNPDLVWVVHAPGHRPVAGGLADLRPQSLELAGTPKGVFHADVVLARTDERVLFVCDEENRPLAGVAVTLDGRGFGVTDALGMVLLRVQPWPPTSWSLELEGWELEGATWEDEESEEEPGQAQDAWMRRVPR